MEQLGTKIFLTNDIAEYSNEELEALEELIAEEFYKRKEREKQEAWIKIIDTFEEYDAKYGIVFEDRESDEEYLLISADKDKCGRFYFS